jgi:hypothetical protein
MLITMVLTFRKENCCLQFVLKKYSSIFLLFGNINIVVFILTSLNLSTFLQERLMADPVEWSRENITFLHENEVNADAENWLAVTVVLKVPPTANQDSVNRELIRCAILDKCRIIVFKSDIMQYDHGYLVRTSGREETQLILNTDFLDVGPNKLIVYPWSPYNGSTCQYFDHIPPNIGMVTPAKRPRESDVLENLKVRGHGLPPHLCTSNVIRKVFSSICRFHKMEIYQGDLSFAIWTFASRQCIPDTWTVAVIKDTMLYMWPLWLFVEGCAPPPAPRSEGKCSYNTFLAPLLLHSSL